jgi:hypothetical protein
MPRSEWATERFIYLHDISQTDSVKRYCACTALVPEGKAYDLFLSMFTLVPTNAHLFIA